MTRKQRYDFVLNYFIQNHPEAETELHFNTPFELLVAVVLSAQCTDKRVNMVTPILFQRFPDVYAMAEASVEEIFEEIKSISYPNNKAKHLSGLAKMLIEEFKGEVPDRLEDLIRLPGVGRKTANVITSVLFDQPSMAVDTHVFRVSARLGLTYRSKTPLETEKQLVAHIPTHLIARAHHWLILHGRYICLARSPKCEICHLQDACQFYQRKVKKNVPPVQ